jgi:hypothetical protein
MELWQYLFEADQREDLAPPDAGAGWLAAQPWGWSADRGWWTARAAQEWGKNVQALRSLASRLKGRRLKRPARVAEPEADARLRRFVSLFRSAVNMAQPRGPKDLALSRRNFRGLGVFPSVSTGRPADPWRSNAGQDGRRVETQPLVQMLWLDDLDLFWQVVFWSLLAEGGPVLCERCGEALGDTTPTGRRKKQRFCGRCRTRAWWAKLPQERKRAKWRDDDQKRRAAGAICYRRRGGREA